MRELKQYPISITEVFRAKNVVESYLRPTSLIYYQGLSSVIDAEVFIMHENHNPTGTFKIRGGISRVHHLKRAGIRVLSPSPPETMAYRLLPLLAGWE